jgi:hypothetical protein
MSREAGRVRALENAARLKHLLEARDRVELFGYALARPEAAATRLPVTAAANVRHDPPPDSTVLRLDA